MICTEVPMTTLISGIPVEITRKLVKNINLTILPPDGKVRISAPFAVPDSYILEFVNSKIKWINRQRDKIAAVSSVYNPKYISGETVYIWGKPYLLKVEAGPKYAFEVSGETALLFVPENSTAESREAFVRRWYSQQLKDRIPTYLAKWEQITGLSCNQWRTKYMKTRWGTCNTSAGRIWLNVRLAEHPTICLKYVILHELLHLLVPNHGPEFQSLIGRYMADWRNVCRLLNAPLSAVNN